MMQIMRKGSNRTCQRYALRELLSVTTAVTTAAARDGDCGSNDRFMRVNGNMKISTTATTMAKATKARDTDNDNERRGNSNDKKITHHTTANPQSFHLFSDDEDNTDNEDGSVIARNFRIDAHAEKWFEINKEELRGSVFVHKNARFLWKPTKVEEITVESLVYVKIVDETPDVLLIGTGEKLKEIDRECLSYMRKLGCAVELMDSANAVATFNVLVEEGRNVACAILLPTKE